MRKKINFGNTINKLVNEKSFNKERKEMRKIPTM